MTCIFNIQDLCKLAKAVNFQKVQLLEIEVYIVYYVSRFA